MVGGLSGPPLEEKERSQGWVVDLSTCPHCKNTWTISSTSQLCFSNSSRDLAYINLSSQRVVLALAAFPESSYFVL